MALKRKSRKKSTLEFGIVCAVFGIAGIILITWGPANEMTINYTVAGYVMAGLLVALGIFLIVTGIRIKSTEQKLKEDMTPKAVAEPVRVSFNDKYYICVNGLKHYYIITEEITSDYELQSSGKDMITLFWRKAPASVNPENYLGIISWHSNEPKVGLELEKVAPGVYKIR